jgi:hypothetical protein
LDSLIDEITIDEIKIDEIAIDEIATCEITTGIAKIFRTCISLTVLRYIRRGRT